MRILLVFLIGITFVTGACKKEEEIQAQYDFEVGAIITKKAILKWYGSPEADRAGLWAEIDTRTYKVVNYTEVSADYYRDAVTVLLTYRRVGKVIYENMGYKAEVDGIEILKIE